MYLKSLELQGFKSFPDKIRLTFDQGFTAVVGPNGSGKSNIGDAVRWVLGEQSTKELRGKSMEDVIFSGTSTRKPMGFAAVTLTIDNADHALADSEPEVAVTRRLYRNGDSEYLINGKQVRLKDINELFMDTGLGRDGYAIIGQGRIAEIVGAKSNERRDIFEEAAGVSKFRYKKSEAERRLKAADENLVRLTDITAELEQRIGPLKSQAEKAEKYVVLAEERKQLEVSVWVEQLKVMTAQMQTMQDTGLRLTAEYESLQLDIRKEEEKVQLAYQDMQQATVDIERLQNQIVATEQAQTSIAAGIAVCETEIRHSETQIAALQTQMTASQDGMADGERKLKEQDAYLAELQERQAQLDAALQADQAMLEKLEAEQNAQGESCAVQDAKLRQLYLQQSELRVRLQTLDADHAETQQALADMTASSDNAGDVVDTIAKQLAAAESQAKNCADRAVKAQNRLDGCKQLEQGKAQKYAQLTEELTMRSNEYRQAQQKQRILRDLEQNMEGYAGSVRQVLRVAGSGRLGGVHGTVAQRITVQPAYGTAIETALGGALQNIIVENEDAAKRCIRYLKEAKGGRATFLPLTTIRGGRLQETLDGMDGFVALACDLVGFDDRYRGVMENLLGRIVVAEDIDAATRIARQFRYRFRIVTLDGQVIHSGGSFTGGSAARSAGVITRTHELEEIAETLKRLEDEQNLCKQAAAKCKAEWDKLKTDVEGAEETLSQCRTEGYRLEQEITRLQTLLQAEQDKQQIGADRKRSLESKLQTLTEQRSTIQTQAEQTDAVIAELQTQWEQEQSEGHRLETLYAECSQRMADTRIRQVGLAKDLENERSRRIQIARNIDQGSERIATLEAQLRQEKSNIVQKQKEIAQLESGKVNQREQIAQMQTKIETLRRTHEQKERYAREVQQGSDALRDAREKLNAERSRVEERTATTQKEMDDIIFRMQDAYELSRSEAETFAQPIEDRKQAETQLATLKSKIRALGNVNVAAIDEYREVSERYAFLSAQMRDVQHSKAELLELIDRLTKDMCTIFSESFAIINRNFGQIFTELFGGGSASLTLTDPENVLESGIEIHVAPPGKVIKNLIALSGGEQSFVAICIYFAILKLRPAPFCILDEIDAALDEVNVRKYAQYLSRFIGKTQFVVITHRRSAMDEANVLYGVTMQEDGVSRLLRLDQNGMASGIE